MIISSGAALRLVSSHAILQQVPELLGAVEAYKTAERQWLPKRNCRSCDKASYFGPVEETALSAIAALPPDAVLRLKTHLGRNELYVNLPQPGQKAKLVELK